MTNDQFIKICTKCGYATKGVAIVYAKDKTELTEDDFIEVFRFFERLMAINDRRDDERFTVFEHGRTTRVIYDEPDKLL